MAEKDPIYTYRCGQKLGLDKSPDEMIVRSLPQDFSDAAMHSSEQMSSRSTRVIGEPQQLEDMMARARQTAPTHHAYYEQQSGSEFLITDRVFVRFIETADDVAMSELMARYALTEKQRYGPRTFLFQLTNQTGMNPVKLVVRLTEQEDLVELAEHDLNQRMKIAASTVPEDPEYLQQWHLHQELNHPEFDPRSSAQCDEAWEILGDFGSEEVVVAVTDDGCRLDHYDFDSEGKFADWGYLREERLITSRDFDARPEAMYIDGSNHGTSCCGVIAGEVDALMTVGAAPGCRLLPLQWESSGPALFISDSKLLTVLAFIADKVDVMSNSWGSTPTSLWAMPVLDQLRELAVTGGRRGKGIVFLWAAGNENCPIEYEAEQPVPYDRGVVVEGGALVWVGVNTTQIFRNNLVGLPALMHVAGLSSISKRSHYSNYGPGISLTAPTSNAHTYFRALVKGLGITTTTGDPQGITRDFGGTSSATPLVAGVAALVISANPSLTAIEVVSLLKRSAAKDLNMDGYPKTLPANFDEDTSWDVSPVAPFDSGDFLNEGDVDGSWSPWFGYGRVNAPAAVSAALSVTHVPSNEAAFSGESGPDRSIPDNNERGIKDSISCTDSFFVTSIQVALSIEHSYIGDLLVVLISPNGTEMILHDRSGSNANDLELTFSPQSHPDLRKAFNEQSEGLWTLRVYDLAARDRGRLKFWKLTLFGNAATPVVVEDEAGLLIPDNSVSGVERMLEIMTEGTVRSIAVDVDITHSYIGDLVVELIAPQGETVLLHNMIGGSEDNIIKQYSLSNTPQLEALLGVSIQGPWRLRIQDLASADRGKLNRWGMSIVPDTDSAG